MLPMVLLGNYEKIFLFLKAENQQGAVYYFIEIPVFLAV